MSDPKHEAIQHLLELGKKVPPGKVINTYIFGAKGTGKTSILNFMRDTFHKYWIDNGFKKSKVNVDVTSSQDSHVTRWCYKMSQIFPPMYEPQFFANFDCWGDDNNTVISEGEKTSMTENYNAVFKTVISGKVSLSSLGQKGRDVFEWDKVVEKVNKDHQSFCRDRFDVDRDLRAHVVIFIATAASVQRVSGYHDACNVMGIPSILIVNQMDKVGVGIGGFDFLETPKKIFEIQDTINDCAKRVVEPKKSEEKLVDFLQHLALTGGFSQQDVYPFITPTESVLETAKEKNIDPKSVEDFWGLEIINILDSALRSGLSYLNRLEKIRQVQMIEYHNSQNPLQKIHKEDVQTVKVIGRQFRSIKNIE